MDPGVSSVPLALINQRRSILGRCDPQTLTSLPAQLFARGTETIIFMCLRSLSLHVKIVFVPWTYDGYNLELSAVMIVLRYLVTRAACRDNRKPNYLRVFKRHLIYVIYKCFRVSDPFTHSPYMFLPIHLLKLKQPLPLCVTTQLSCALQ